MKHHLFLLTLLTAVAAHADPRSSTDYTITALFDLTVLDSIADNFGGYAGDGLGDDWQVQYFGLDNPDAAPGIATDGTGLTNLFKYTAGLIPNDSTSDFLVEVEPVNGQPTHKTISFSPAFADRQYTILFSTNLTDWDPLTGPVAGNDGIFVFTDTDAAAPRNFYQVKVTKP